MSKRDRNIKAMPWLLEEVSPETASSPKKEEGHGVSFDASASEQSALEEQKDTQPGPKILEGTFSEASRHIELLPAAPKKGYRHLPRILAVCSTLLFLLTLWMGIGLTMKMGLLPWLDLGYSWLDGLFRSLR